MKLKRILRLLLKIILFVVIAFVLILGYIIIYSTVKDYKPTHKEKLEISGKGFFNVANDSMFTILSWNIGYCGLGKEMDFFYDGGTTVRAPKENFQRYLNGVLNFLEKKDSVDMILIQEVDTSAKRTYYVNEVKLISQFLPRFSYVFAKNYDVRFVPVPWYSPMGYVISGLMTLSKIKPVEATRYPYYANFDWPKSIFMLKRCLIYTKFKLPGGKDLIVLNTHSSAFDDAAELREVEGYVIKATMLDEYAKGNYVVVGGDWNRNPPQLDLTKMTNSEAKRTIEPALGKDFLPPGWKCIYDPTLPTNRDVDAAYKKGKTRTTIIDYFIISPNLYVIENKTIPTGWEFSDHQPIFVRLKMKPDTTNMKYDSLIKEIEQLKKPKWTKPKVKK